MTKSVVSVTIINDGQQSGVASWDKRNTYIKRSESLHDSENAFYIRQFYYIKLIFLTIEVLAETRGNGCQNNMLEKHTC